MDIKFKKVRSAVYPELIDKTSSKVVTYIRKNVEEVEETNDTTGEKVKMFQYDEAELTKLEYVVYEASQVSDEAVFGAQLAIAELAETVELQNTETQLAIAELAELILGE